MLLVFVLSALFHEFVLAGGLGFLYPVLLAMFGGPGVIFVWCVVLRPTSPPPAC